MSVMGPSFDLRASFKREAIRVKQDSRYDRKIRIAGTGRADYPEGGMNSVTERRWWRATLRKEASFDGRFVFAVTTTGIYCRPTCPARRPHVEHVRFYAGPKQAEREGYRACKRCGPN